MIDSGRLADGGSCDRVTPDSSDRSKNPPADCRSVESAIPGFSICTPIRVKSPRRCCPSARAQARAPNGTNRRSPQTSGFCARSRELNSEIEASFSKPSVRLGLQALLPSHAPNQSAVQLQSLTRDLSIFLAAHGLDERLT